MFRFLPSRMTPPAKITNIPKNGVDYRGKVVLAPMVRSGELPSRLLALKYGADLVWGPETIDRSMIGTRRSFNPATSTIDFTRLPSNASRRYPEPSKESLIYRIHPEREQGRLIFQLGTASPDTAVKAADLVARDVAGIDVNAGCPKPFSTSGGMGAALLQDPDRLAAILTALVNEIGGKYQIGISVKIRLLENMEQTSALVEKLCKTGITGLTVHCRTTPMRPRERAIREQLSMIGQICQRHHVACLMNGDVKNRDEARELMHEYGMDGAMIATAAESNPSCFRSQQGGGLLPWVEVVKEYLKIALDVDNKWGNTKFLLGQLIPGKDEAFRRMASSMSYRQLCEAFGFDEQMERAQAVDLRLGLDEGRQTKGMKKAAFKNKIQGHSSMTNAQNKLLEEEVQDWRSIPNLKQACLLAS